MNEFQIKNQTDLLYKQALIRDIMMDKELSEAVTYDDVVSIVGKYFKDFYLNAGKPVLTKRYPTTGVFPIAEDYNGNCSDIDTDLTILYSEYQDLAGTIADYFNYRQTEKEKLLDRVRYLTGLCSDLSLIANVDNPNCIYIKDTFTTADNIDVELTDPIARAHIATREGVVTLGRTDSVNRSVNSAVSIVQGNGTSGNYHVAITDSGSTIYACNNGAHDDSSVILDGNPDTWYEYQAVNFSDEQKRGLYNVDWGQSTKTNDLLRIRMVVDLKDVYDINWITINPYNPPKSNGKVVVHSIQTSEDGLTYVPLYTDNLVLNAELNYVPQTYRKDEIVIDDYMPSKFAGQGVWSFETRAARFVEVVMDQPQSYDELLGHTYYERVTTSGSTTVKVRIPEGDAPQEAVSGPAGKYVISNTEYIQKDIEPLNGWRYCIGVRDVSVYSYTFKSKGEIISKTFTTQRPIKKVMLYVNEKIPPTFLTDLTQSNNWIKYSISLDGNKWYPISPTHRRPVGNETTSISSGTFPPKIYEINPRTIPAIRQTEIYKGYITTDKEPTTIKLKATLSRPDDKETMTPLIEDYTLKIYFEE